MWAMQTDNASVTLRAEGSDLGSLPPVSTLVPAWVPGAHPLDQQLPLQALPAVLWPGTPCIPLYSSFTGLWAHSSTVWEEGFFFFFFQKHENNFAVKSIQCNLGEERADSYPLLLSKIFHFASKGAKEACAKGRAVRAELGAETSL